VRREYLVRWIPETHRLLLRPGGRLWFLRNSVLSIHLKSYKGCFGRSAERPQSAQLQPLETSARLAVKRTPAEDI
jgi:hypothetical protein